MQFRYAILYVDNVQDSLAFFKTVFGFDIFFVHEEADYGELDTGSTKLAFSSTSLMQSLGKNPQQPDPARPTFELAFETDDVTGTFAKALAAGATPVQEARDEPWGQTTAYVSDPNGFLIEICTPMAQPSD